MLRKIGISLGLLLSAIYAVHWVTEVPEKGTKAYYEQVSHDPVEKLNHYIETLIAERIDVRNIAILTNEYISSFTTSSRCKMLNHLLQRYTYSDGLYSQLFKLKANIEGCR